MTKEKVEDPHGGPLAKLGERLIDNGYEIIPIAVGKKAPGFDNWSKSRSTKGQLKEWIMSGHRMSGVGVLTRRTPAIDLDIRDSVVAEEAEAKVREIFGDAPLRFGMRPKRLMVFRTDEPFRKMRTTKYVDEWGDEHQIEILCDGQQFVAYHTHPDTHRPYEWPQEDGPLHTQQNELTTITVEQCQELIDWFEERAKLEPDWKIKKASRSSMTGNIDLDNPFLEDSTSIDISEDDLRARLLLVPNPEDYDTWVQVGMALYHQFDGEEIGLELWNEWAETADNYDKDACDRRWDDFGISGKKRAPITARYILRLSKEAVETTTAALAMELHEAFSQSKDKSQWEKARMMAREAEIDGLARSSLASVAKEALDRIMQSKTPLIEIKKAIAYQPAKGERTPSWVEPYVYDTSDDRFFSTTAKFSTTQQGFNAMHDRKAMTKKDVLDGKSAPSNTASALALNLYKIPTVQGRRYQPGSDPIFYSVEGTFANTYPEHEIPELPEKLLPRDKRAVERVKRHIKHLLEKPEEQRMLLDWISWVVQNPGQHANYSILLQGVEGDGKSFFGQMMALVMGVSNVRMMNAHILESPFTDWAVGQCLACVEEVRLIKHTNKYEILNRIKPFITNKTIEVHPKGSKPYNARNTTSYLLFSNFRDALPLDDDGRRFLVLFSRWQSREKLAEWLEEQPDYYVELYQAIEDCAPALRAWLLGHEQLPDFKPFGNAPMTDARKYMVRQAQPEFIQVLNDIILDNECPDICAELINLSALADELNERNVDLPPNKAMGAMLARHGFESLGKLYYDGSRVTFCTRCPELFQVMGKDGPVVEPVKVREFITNRRRSDLDDDEL